MATEYGTKVTYASKPNSTEGVKSETFWGLGHASAASATLMAASLKANADPATLYHVFETQHREVADKV